MANKVLLCVSAQHATAAYWHAGKIVRLQQFTHDDAGLTQFREFLTGYANVPVYVMVDAVEEDYRFETLPHTMGADRAQLVARKLKQHYRNTPYVGAWLQGRDKEKRRDDRYLFAAFTNPEILTDWLRIINGQEMPLAGVYLLAMVTEGLLQRLQVNLPNLLVAAQHAGGLRLTFFRSRQFRLSRLTRGDTAKTADPVRVFAGEIANTRLYLHALRTATLDEHLTVLLLDRNDDLADVAAAIINDNPSVDCVRVTRDELAARLAMAPQHVASSPDALYLQLLGLQKGGANLAPAQATVGYRRYRLQRGIYAACGAVAAIAAVWIGTNAWDAYGTNSQATEVAAQVRAQEVQYQQITREFPPTPTTGENLKRAVDIAQSLRDSARDPTGAMAIVSRALDATPNVVIREFGWKYATSDIDKRVSGGSAPAPASPAATPGAPGLAPKPRHQSAFVAGEIRPFRGDYRGAIETINALAERIRRHPAVQEVRAVRMPLNVSPGSPLSGNTLDTRSETGAAEFELAVVLKPRV